MQLTHLFISAVMIVLAASTADAKSPWDCADKGKTCSTSKTDGTGTIGQCLTEGYQHECCCQYYSVQAPSTLSPHKLRRGRRN